MTGAKSGVFAIAAVAALSFSTQASAQTCSQVASEWQSKSAHGYRIRLSITTAQKNGLVSTSAYATINNSVSGQNHLMWEASQMRFVEDSCYGSGVNVFSDRYRSDISTQPFSTQSNSVDPYTFSLNSTLSSGVGTNLRWGSSLSFSTVSCANGVIYGWGTAVGNTNGAPALWVLTWSYEPATCIG